MPPLRDDPPRAHARAAGIRPGNAAQSFVGHGAGFTQDAQGFTLDETAGFPALPGVGADQDRRYYAAAIKPTVFLNLVPDHVIVLRMTPLAVDSTQVECDWLYAAEVVSSGSDVGRSVELFHRVNLQDFDACERTQPGMSSRAYVAGGVLVPAEHHLSAFHGWVRDRIG